MTQMVDARVESQREAGHHPSHLHQLSSQIKHNLIFQHQWTEVQEHTHHSKTGTLLPRPLISGLPPSRLYVHPDEQVELLKLTSLKSEPPSEQASSSQVSSITLKSQNTGSSPVQPSLGPIREWVLPTHVREKWSLRKFADVFDALESAPSGEKEPEQSEHSTILASKWNSAKRLVMAILSDDSTVVYYIVHDGLVKPRQN